MTDYARRASRQLQAAVAVDPQFRRPQRPRLWTTSCSPSGDGLLLDGGPQRRLLRGSVAQGLPDMLALLDGERTAEDVVAASGRRAAEIDGTLSLLYAAGALEDGEGPVAEPSSALSYLRRMGDSTRVNRSGGEALERLRAARVAVLGDPELAAALAAAFGGLCHVEALEPDATVDPSTTVVTGDADIVRRLAGFAGVLPVLAGATTMAFGPLVASDPAVCATCVADDLAGSAGGRDAATTSLLASLLACELTALVSRVGDAPSRRMRVVVDRGSWERRLDLVPRRPECPSCGSGPAQPGIDETPYRYEQAVALPPRELLNPKEHQVHFKASSVELQERRKTYPSAPRVPAQELGPLADVARRCVGLRPRELQLDAGYGLAVDRYAPTGGNLGSPQLYLATAGGEDAWFYDPAEDAFCALAGEALGPRLVAQGRRCPGVAAGVDVQAVLVLTGALDRVAEKYRLLAYRVVHLDGGIAAYHAVLAARAGGRRPFVAERWCDDELHALLGTDREREPVTGLIVIAGEERS